MRQRDLRALVLIFVASTTVFGGKPTGNETFGGKQRFVFRDDVSADGILSDIQGAYVPPSKGNGSGNVFSEITLQNHVYSRYYLITYDSGRTAYVDFNRVIQGDPVRMPQSGFYEFSLWVGGELYTMLPGETQTKSAKFQIYYAEDDHYYALRAQSQITALDTNGNGIVDSFYVEVSQPLTVARLAYENGPVDGEDGLLGSIEAPCAGTIVDAELK